MEHIADRFKFFSHLTVALFLTALPMSAIALESKPKATQDFSAEDLERRVSSLRKVLKQSPQSVAAKQNLSIALSDWAQGLIQKKQAASAVEKLKEAVNIAPQNGPAWFSLGDIVYLQNSNFNEAVLYWKKALPLAPIAIQKQIQERISRAELDKHLEQGYASISSMHFLIRFPADFSKAEAVRVGKYMEAEYGKLSTELKVSPEKLTLIIYQKQSFDRVTGSHDETLGLYDGRIRIGVREVGGEYESVILSHELAHAFLQNAFGSNLPIWIQEGYAQSKEPERPLTPEQTKIKNDLLSGVGWIPVKWLDRKFSQPSNLDDVSRSYLQSRIIVAFLLRKSGSGDFQLFLSEISKGKDVESAFKASFKGLSWNTVEYGRFN